MIERLYAYSGEVNDAGLWSYYGKVGGVLTTGNEDGGKHVSGQVLYALQHIGLTVPPQSDAYWTGPDRPDPARPTWTPTAAASRTTEPPPTPCSQPGTSSISRECSKDTGGIPAYGNSTRDWDLDEPRHSNPEYR